MKNQKGFTLLEMMIVVAIMGMLAGAFMPSLFNQLDKADEARVGHDLNQLSLQLKMFYIDERKYPKSKDGLGALVPDYIDAIPSDPFGVEYLYKKSSRGGVSVYTLGADGEVGGEGNDADTYKKVKAGRARSNATTSEDGFNPFSRESDR
jgi:general secretion pathway protein G